VLAVRSIGRLEMRESRDACDIGHKTMCRDASTAEKHAIECLISRQSRMPAVGRSETYDGV
jgi:hypothetical protein